ncbi:serine/threonine protein kinase [Corallococcus llansteffanensis]|uniref:non-specific serine/threonine protein kinase n=1 Tax=Corallococcus llansteffanensis TaxID=2316731 RepID=A0A3A8PD20_9BACT|nr:serine/threonine-protein kinase [Corallococcus llansteffanensis]RKH53170.1 serine/threonine protein kinase [Corallococcus llansteffanensis]
MSPRLHPVVPPGTDIGGYLVEEKLGAGGFGAVYRARRGGRRYALKLIPFWGLAEWAEREVAILLRLKHSNLVRIRGHGQWPDEAPQYFFIVMDYVEGRRLDVWAREENPSAREVVLKVRGVARGLGAAHRAKVVHRDLKESNVIERASDGEAVVVDFGAGGYESAPSITGGVLPPGTPEYRAPEAWRFQQEHGDERGRSYQPGPSDDLYSLGVVLYGLLTGRQPFLPDEAAGVEAVLNRAPKPPHVLNPRVPEALSIVCMRLLAKEPEERPPDADALCAELEALLAQVDESWDVKLCDAYGPDTATTLAAVPHAVEDELVQWLKKRKARPRRGPRPPNGEGAHDPDSNAVAIQAELPLPIHARPGPTTVPPPAQARHFNALRVATGMGLLVVLSVLVLTRNLMPSAAPVAHHAQEPHSSAASLSPPIAPTLALALWAPGQEVAAPWMAPEAQQAAAALDGAPTLAAVALSATLSEEKASVKMKKNTGVPPGKALGLGIAACLTMACPGPQLRPTPPPEECPRGAAEAMRKLRIDDNTEAAATLFATLEEGVSRNVTVRAGPTMVLLGRSLGDLPPRTMLSGRLIVGDERVYGRLTEARTPKGDRVPVCIQIIEDAIVGLRKEPNGGADTASVYPYFDVKAVRRFE